MRLYADEDFPVLVLRNRLTKEWVNEGQAVDGPRRAHVLRVEGLHAAPQTGAHQEGVPEREGVAGLEGLRFRPEVGHGKENDIGQGPHRRQGRQGLCFRKACHRKFSAGRDELATDLSRQRKGPGSRNKLLGESLLVWVARVMAVQPDVGVNGVHEVRRGRGNDRPSRTRMTGRARGNGRAPRRAPFPAPLAARCSHGFRPAPLPAAARWERRPRF